MIFLGCGLLIAGAGCRPYLNNLPTQLERSVVKSLNDMQWYSEAYGFAGISSPLLVQPDEKFRFDPPEANATMFFESAKKDINARSAGLFQSVTSGGLGISAQVDFLALQQQLTSLRSGNQDSKIVEDRQRLLSESAQLEFQAAMAAAQLNTDPVKRLQMEAAAYRALAANLPGPSATSAPPTTTQSPPLSSDYKGTSASGLLGTIQPQTLYPVGAPAVTNDMRSALVTAAGNTAINAILSLLGNPEKAAGFSDKKLMFAVTEVTVNPGWLTQKNYSADVASKIMLNFIPADHSVREAFFQAKFDTTTEDGQALDALRSCVKESLRYEVDDNLFTDQKIPEPYNKEQFRPFLANNNRGADLVVSAVSPMADTQVLDMQSSMQQRREFALQISALLGYAGVKGAADSFLKWATQHQKDAQSRTANVVANSYSLSGGHFGFHVGPRFQADPDDPDTSKALQGRMDRQSFPALLLVGVDKEAVRPRIQILTPKPKIHESDQSSEQQDVPCAGQSTCQPGQVCRCVPKEAPVLCRLMEPRVQVRTYTTWRPLENTRKAKRFSADEYFRIRKQTNDALDRIRDCRRKASETNNKPAANTSGASAVKLEGAPSQSKVPKTSPGECKGSERDLSCKAADECMAITTLDSEEYENRANYYRARLIGATYAFKLPERILTESIASLEANKTPPAPPAPPKVAQIFPSRVEVPVRVGGAVTAGTGVELVVTGEGLSKVDLAKIQPVSGSVTWVDDKGTTKSGPSAELVGGAIRLRFLVSGNDPVIVFGLPLQDGSPADVLKTPPLSVVVPPAKSSTIVIKKEGGTETYTFSPDVSDDVKKAVLEKDKPKVVTVKKDEATTTVPTK